MTSWGTLAIQIIRLKNVTFLWLLKIDLGSKPKFNGHLEHPHSSSMSMKMLAPEYAYNMSKHRVQPPNVCWSTPMFKIGPHSTMYHNTSLRYTPLGMHTDLEVWFA